LRPKRVSVLAAVALLPLSLAACDVIGPQADTSPVVIGADLELTGVNADIGNTYKQALELKIAQLNAGGGIDGHQVQLVVRDNHNKPETAVADIAALTTESNVTALVMGSCSDCLLAVAKTIEDKKIPTIALATAKQVTNPVAERHYIFKINPNSEDDADVLAGRLRGDAIHRYALLTTDDTNGRDAMTAIKAANRALSAVTTQQFNPNDTNLSSVVHQALARDPAGLVISAFPAQAMAIALAARQAAFTGEMYFDAPAAGELFQPNATAAAADGVTMVAPQTLVISDIIATSPAETARKQWFDAYTSKVGSFSGYSLYAADAVQLVATAMHTAGGTDRDQLRDAMENTQMDGVSGPLRFKADNHSGLAPQAVTAVVAANGRWRLIN
jgi:branched-chain amino acid transport system substrate-binding protein